MAEAVDSHIGGWFWNAAARARIRPVAQPQYDYELPTGDEGDWQFTATVPVQPKVDVVDWTELEVGKPEAEVPEELVTQELEALRESVAELVPAGDRPAKEGDTLVVDIVSPEGEAQRDTVVELGSGRLVEEVEAALVGASAGETKSVAYELADESTLERRDHGQGDQREGAARARRRARPLVRASSTRSTSCAPTSSSGCARPSTRRSRTPSAPTPSTRSSPPRRSRRRARSSSRARASCSPASSARSSAAGSRPRPTCS